MNGLCGIAAVVGLGLGGFLGLWAEGAQALTFFDTEVTCPIDGKTFKTKAVGSYTQFGMRLDLKPVGALVAPIPLPVCPENGFVVYQEKFSDDELVKLEAIVLTDAYRQLSRQHTSRYMVAYMQERMGADDYKLAHLYLQASWEAEGHERPLLDQYRALSLEKFDALLKRDNSRSSNWWTAAVMSAELERLLGRFDGVERRIAALPLAELEGNATPNGGAILNFVEQIRAHAKNANAAPEQSKPRPSKKP